VENKDDLLNAFGSNTYAKGASLLAMFEAWIGEAKFRSGIRRYLAAHRDGTAGSADFLRAIEAESRPGVARAFSTFLDQPGAPLLEASLACGPEGNRIEVSQKRLLPVGSKGSSGQLWRIPVCARYGRGEETGRACTLLTKASASMALPSAAGCPDWVLANEGALGYYRGYYRGDLLARLVSAGSKLTIAEQRGILRDAANIVETGVLPVGTAFDLAARYVDHSSWHLALDTVRLTLAGERLLPDDLRSAYARFVSRTFSPRARALGFAPKPGDDADTRLLRESLVRFAASDGDDPELRAQAKALALAWLADRGAVDAQVVSDALTVAAERGDRPLFDRFHEAARRSVERGDRERLLKAMGSFRDPAILKDALAILLTDEFNALELPELLWAAAEQDSNRPIVWEFFKQNYDAILAKTPGEGAGFLPYVPYGACDEDTRRDVEDFFRDRVGKLQGGAYNLARVLEGIDNCVALKGAQEAGLRAFLEKY
jgi:alanyl aminopeptidase